MIGSIMELKPIWCKRANFLGDFPYIAMELNLIWSCNQFRSNKLFYSKAAAYLISIKKGENFLFHLIISIYADVTTVVEFGWVTIVVVPPPWINLLRAHKGYLIPTKTTK